MRYPRASGILLHVTSLPSPYGIGDLGPEAYRFIDFLQRNGQSIWQVLPLNPTGYGNSPYQGLSAFAGNPWLVSLERLVMEGWLSNQVLDAAPAFAENTVDFAAVSRWRGECLAQAFEQFQRLATEGQREEFELFRQEHAVWLEEYALFVAAKEANQESLWTHWQRALVHRKPAALTEAKGRFKDRMDREAFIQYQFLRQWTALRQYAAELGVRLMGDLPIFISHDSSDVWSNQGLFHLDADGWPTVIAGVPPDYFSETGQRWGNPLYRWEVMRADGYRWWIQRVRHLLNLFDLIRVDHFRGFEGYWEIPAEAPDATSGRWVPGPGATFFQALEVALGKLPIVAEDLGVITPPVEALRDEIGAPGMRVLQFAFGTTSKAPDYRPHRFVPHTVVYTGTHDNDTTVGWYHSEANEGSTRTQGDVERERAMARAYLGPAGEEIQWQMIRMALGSVADTAIIPLQDVLGLGNEARMNLPGSSSGNWTWRFRWDQLTPELESRLLQLTEIYERSDVHRTSVPPLQETLHAGQQASLVSGRDHL